MATFAELVADTYLITNRPDLVNETKLAVKAATLKAHHSDYFPKDLYEVAVNWATPDYVQSIEYRTLIPRWRALKYLRKLDSTGLIPTDFFTLLTPEMILDRYGIQKENVCYLAGEMLEIKSSTQDSYMTIGCYLHPVLDENSYSSWIALDHPYAIVFEAARTVYKQIGFDEQATVMRQETAEQYAILKQEVVAQGY